ncbi:MAG: fibronectin type III domain-containing protein [Solirubrobacterales bacterium]|nr:fibronectin type III domain-containing protein [Solirubrobacterales bacterium]
MKRRLAMLTAVTTMSALAAGAVAVAASSPTVATGTRSNVTDTSAVLHGSVNPNGSATTYFFQWGLTNAYGVQSVAHSAAHDTKPVSVSAVAAVLIPGTVYHYRVVATNAAGTAVGADRTFKTAGNPPPGVTTGPATEVGKNSAIVTAVISPNNQATTYYFQYGTSTAYLQQTIAATVPAGTAPVTVAASLQGLEARTIFHYRIVALHSNTAPQPDGDATFMMLPRHRPVPNIHARTRPSRARHRPFVFTTSGSVKGPNWIPTVYDCRGNVTVRFLLGRRSVGATLVPLQPNCTFSGQAVFARVPGHHRPATLTVRVRFAGNGYLTPRRAATETVTLG